jgi:ribosome-binding protein aMBF1 (putative translation factor)
MINKKLELNTYEMKHYKGSLDFPCDFCGSNSYDNIHIEKNESLIVVCKACIDKCLKEKE